MAEQPTTGGSLWVKGLAPLLLLGALLLVFVKFGPVGVFREATPPVEDLSVQRITFPRAGEMRVRVVNGGLVPARISQVLVDQASWSFTLDGPPEIGRLQSRTLTLPYPWVQGDPLEVTVLTGTGLTFTGTVEVAVRTPAADARYLSTFALLGIYAGVIPVFLGLLWFPFLRGISRRWLDFFLSLTVGLLLFLGVSALFEALDTAALVPSAFQGTALVLIGVVGTPLAIAAIGRARGGARTPLYVATLIALGIGLHNLGEGLAIGTAYTSGKIALGTFLVIGFLLHNTTEGLGIIAPVAAERPRVRDLVLLGALAGVPTVIGTWIGGFTYSPLWTTLFLAVGAGAIVQVIYELWRIFAARSEGGVTQPLNFAGLMLGLLIMYSTGLLVA